MAQKVIAFFLLTGSQTTRYDSQTFGGLAPTPVPDTTECLTGTMAVDITNGDILDLDFGGYRISSVGPANPYTESQSPYFSLKLTNNAAGATNFTNFAAGEFSVSSDPVVDVGGGERRAFILIQGTTSPLVQVTVAWPDPPAAQATVVI